MNKEENPIEVDFSHQDTEAGWIRILDNFAKKGTPVWFNWIGWFLLLGALQYFFIKSRSILVAIICGLSTGFLWIYFQAFFFSIRFKNVPILRNFKNQRAVSMILSGIVAYTFWQVSLRIARVIMENQ